MNQTHILSNLFSFSSHLRLWLRLATWQWYVLVSLHFTPQTVSHNINLTSPQGRVILHVTPSSFRNIKNLWVPPRWMTPIFVTCDIVAFLIQVFGATSATSKDPKVVQRGYNVMKVGLVIQLVCFGFFLVVSLRFHFISKKFESSWPDRQWKKLLMAINIASGLIFVCSPHVFPLLS